MDEANLVVEKRANPRVPVKIPVKFHLVDEMAGIQFVIDMSKTLTDTQTLDISLNGLYIVADQKLNPGSILYLEITLPGSTNPLTAFGEVVWSKESGAGLRFVMIENEVLMALEAFLKEPSSKM